MGAPVAVDADGLDGGLQLGLDLNKVDIEALLACLPVPEVAAPRTRTRAARQQQAAAHPPPPSSTGASLPSGRHSRVHGPALAGGCCGERLRFLVTVCDQAGEVCRNCDALVTVFVEGLSLMSKTKPEPRPRVENNLDGTYSVQFLCATPGLYNITALVEGVPLPMCPIQIDVRPGSASAHQSEVQGKERQVVDAGGPGSFTVITRDEFGNHCGEGGARLGVRALGHAKLHEVTDNEDGTYQVHYSVPEWAQGPVKIEVLLDGVRLKDSPVVPQVRRSAREEDALTAPAADARPGGGSLQDQLERLRWLRENPPVEVPRLPPAHLAEGAALGICSAPGGAAADGGPAAAVAWRAADEWRRLSEARAEIALAREELKRHQEMLLSVGNAVHGEFVKAQDRDRGIATKKAELEQVENQLQALRAELGRQYMQQQRLAVAAGPGSPGNALGYPPQQSASLLGGPGARDWSALEGAGRVEDPLLADELAQLAALREGFERKKRYLLQLEEADRFQTAIDGGSPSGQMYQLAGSLAESPHPEHLPPSTPPLDALPPPAPPPARDPPRNRMRHNLLTEPLPPPKVPPSVCSPPPPRSPNRARAPASPELEGWPQSPTGGADADIGRVMRHIFHSYASKTGGSVALPPRGGRSGRVTLCKQDLLRLAQAAQLRLRGAELEDAFDSTARRFGTLNLAHGGAEPTLPFELFVELVAETARRHYSDLPEGEATRLLFDHHLTPLSGRLAELQG